MSNAELIFFVIVAAFLVFLTGAALGAAHPGWFFYKVHGVIVNYP